MCLGSFNATGLHDDKRRQILATQTNLGIAGALRACVTRSREGGVANATAKRTDQGVTACHQISPRVEKRGSA